MAMEEQIRTGSYAGGGFLTGALVGVVIGVLFAPKSGSETRENVRDWLQKARERSQEMMARGQEGIRKSGSYQAGQQS